MDGVRGDAVRVLVVSEDPKERLRAGSALTLRADAEVTEAATVDDARRRLVRDGERFDVLVVDGDLYPRGGFAMLYDLRGRFEMDGVEPIPAVVLVSRDQDRWLASWAGANDTLAKPVDPFELARLVTSLEGAPVSPYGDAGAAALQVAAAAGEQV